MCYSSSKDFGWGQKKEAYKEPEPQQEKPRVRPEPHKTAPDFTFWAFPRRRKTPAPQQPAAHRTHEKV